MTEESQETASSKRPRKLSSRVLMVVRRTHLYAGLFLLPWVFLFGITGAMFNHQNLFPETKSIQVSDIAVRNTAIPAMPSAEDLASRVVEALNTQAEGKTVALSSNASPQFTGSMLFETWSDVDRLVVHVDPVDRSARIVRHPPKSSQPTTLLKGVNNVTLGDPPMRRVQDAVPSLILSSGFDSLGQVKPIGWTKLNFLADVDGEPARVTYVLKDGHVDITKFDGSHGLSPRRFFLRLHTTHIMSPYWNGRTFWVIAADAMAIAMVVWGVSGLLMWWQIKRTRLVGGVVILASIATATWMFLSVGDFYATTKL